jgi:hypothetical protein
MEWLAVGEYLAKPKLQEDDIDLIRCFGHCGQLYTTMVQPSRFWILLSQATGWDLNSKGQLGAILGIMNHLIPSAIIRKKSNNTPKVVQVSNTIDTIP